MPSTEFNVNLFIKPTELLILTYKEALGGVAVGGVAVGGIAAAHNGVAAADGIPAVQVGIAAVVGAHDGVAAPTAGIGVTAH